MWNNSSQPLQASLHNFKVRPTNQRYPAAKIFMYHYSDLSPLHLQNSLTYEDTVQAKRYFEVYSQKLGFKIMRYHARPRINAFSQNLDTYNVFLWIQCPLPKW